MIGERILRVLPGLGDVARIVRHEHERWDGGGYPDGLVGEAIPLGSRIIIAADTYHAITSDRPYRAAQAPRRGGRGADPVRGLAVRPERHRSAHRPPLWPPSDGRAQGLTRAGRARARGAPDRPCPCRGAPDRPCRAGARRPPVPVPGGAPGPTVPVQGGRPELREATSTRTVSTKQNSANARSSVPVLGLMRPLTIPRIAANRQSTAIAAKTTASARRADMRYCTAGARWSRCRRNGWSARAGVTRTTRPAADAGRASARRAGEPRIDRAGPPSVPLWGPMKSHAGRAHRRCRRARASRAASRPARSERRD